MIATIIVVILLRHLPDQSDGDRLNVTTIVSIQRDWCQKPCFQPQTSMSDVDPEPRHCRRQLKKSPSEEASQLELGAWSALTGDA